MDGEDNRSENYERNTRVIFIGTHNSARSQMAEGYLRAHHGELFAAESAGTEATRVHPAALAVMEEIGIDISGHRSGRIDELPDREFDIVVTVCDSARQACPLFPGAGNVIHAGFPDPSPCRGTPAECLAQFRLVRNAIMTWIDTEFVPECRHSCKISSAG